MKFRYFILFYFVAFCKFSNASIINVGKQFYFQQIQPAINAAQPHDTIMVFGGVYQEGNIKIKSPIHLLGIDWPVIDGDKKYEVFTISADSVSLSGFIIQHSGFAALKDPGGIKIVQSKHVTLENNILYDNFFGIYLQESKLCLIKNNKITAIAQAEQEIGNGIHCWKSDSLQIIGNQIKGHRDGIYFEFVTHSLVWRNIVKQNIRYGLHFMFSNNDTYIGNVFKANGAGVAVMFTKHVAMINNHFIENWGASSFGLLLKEIGNSYISKNKFYKNTVALYAEGTSNSLIEYNQFEQSGWALKMQASCLENTIKCNNFIGNTFDATTNGALVLNKFSNNFWDKNPVYDINKDGVGDVPYHPLSIFSSITENNQAALLLYQSFLLKLLEYSEKVFPSLLPNNFVDQSPAMKAFNI